LLDADEEEVQIIGRCKINGGGSKTFGTSGSAIGWLGGTSITFQAVATLRVGVKKAASIDAANGPAARATIGAAAFDVYDDLVGGVDTISSSTWRNDAMSAGTPFTVADGDLLAVCFHLDITAAAQSVKVRSLAAASTTAFPAMTLVTSGPTYTALTTTAPNIVIVFDDGTVGWIEQSQAFIINDTASATIGNTNIFGNIINLPFSCKIDALAATCNPSTNAANFALELYSTPLGTPSLVESIAFDANITAAVAGNRMHIANFTTPRTLTINTDYAIGVKQTTATAVTVAYTDVNATTHWPVNGLNSTCYAANSTAGATFGQVVSGVRRYRVWARISALDDGVSAGGGGRPEFRGGNL
jgi:hypothetical protein